MLSIARIRPVLLTTTKILPNVSKYSFATDKIFFQRGYASGNLSAQNSLQIQNPTELSSSKITNINYSSSPSSTIEPNQELDSVRYEKISDETLESLTEYFDELVERAAHLPDADVSYGDGVLTVKFGNNDGTYVINRQTPNKQIWLSSPKSGPKRYDFIDGRWLYKHDGITLHELLNKEIPAIVKTETTFERYVMWDFVSGTTNTLQMEIMEDGNLADRVRILLQRDMKYYQEKQTVLRERICLDISGGKLDFPRHASFAATKIVIWWEAEFTAAFNQSSGLSPTNAGNSASASDNEVVKQCEPSEFVAMVVDTSDQLLEHLHTLTQEALDHADLTVLTATLGAAALIRNCLWIYIRRVKATVSEESCASIHKCFKSYQEIAQALAERLLDLHCRLISLYILNEADSLSWQSSKPFFEKERCSFVIQMWWLYMQGTKEDLWNTVPPKMAQRVFSGMLDESLTILTARFVHGQPSLARCEQFWADVFNVLCCTADLSLATFTSGNEMLGFDMARLPIISRNIHMKCGEMLVALLLRGTPLTILYQIFRDGLDNLEMTLPCRGPVPWLVLSTPSLLHSLTEDIDNSKLLQDNLAIIFEIRILRAQPQPDWQQLLKTLLMRKCKVSALLFHEFIEQSCGCKTDDSFMKREWNKASDGEVEGCGGFLCPGNSCYQPVASPSLWLYSLTYISISADMDANNVIISSLLREQNWSECLNREQVWNQIRPAWLHAMITPLYPIMVPIISTLFDAIKTGASISQAMSLTLVCFEEQFICMPTGLLRTALALNDHIPAHCHPIGGSVVFQILCAALYTTLIKVDDVDMDTIDNPVADNDVAVGKLNPHRTSDLAITLAEAVCSIDEDDQRALQIGILLRGISERVGSDQLSWHGVDTEGTSTIAEAYADELSFTAEGRLALKVIHDYVMNGSDWILNSLESDGTAILPTAPKYVPSTADSSVTSKPLLHVMFHIGPKTFDQLLIDYEQADWSRILRIPQAITIERIRSQILKRPEFKDASQLKPSEKEVIEALKLLCLGPDI